MMNLQRKLSLIVGCVAMLLLSSCGKSPEAAAQEVCDCMSKTAKSADIGAMAGNAAECQEIAAKYQGKYSGQELNTFTRTLTNCTMGSASRLR